MQRSRRPRTNLSRPAASALAAAALVAAGLTGLASPARAATASSLAALFTNAGISDDATPTTGNLDGGGYSLSAEGLAAVGWAPNAQYALADGASVQVPNVAPGQADNALANGQTFALAGAGPRLDFIATSTDGNTSGTGTVTYTDGSTQTYTLSVPDWFTGTANFAAQTGYRNGPSGAQAHQINLFDASIALTAGKTVSSVTLPAISSTAVNTAALHVFAAVIAPASGPTGLSAAFNNVGITDNAATTAGNMDGTGQTLSAEALAAAGWTPGARVTANGTTLAWPDVPAGAADNVVANGQRIVVGGSGDALSFLVNSTGAATSGSGTVTYTDGSTQTYTLAAPDWYMGPTDTMAVQLASWNTPGGNAAAPIKLYAVTVPLNSAKTVSAVTLPAVSAAPSPTTAAMHVFALAVRPTAANWSGTWAAGVDDGLVNGPWTNRTLRMVEHSSVGGSTARIRLDNAFGTAPVVIGHATIAVQSSASSAAAAPVTLTFSGNRAGTIPAGGQLVSDPVGFALPQDANLLVSLFLPGPVQLASYHSLGEQDMYSTADQAGDHTADVANYPVNNTFDFWTLLSGVDVVPATAPGTVVAFGDSITDGVGSTYDGNTRWPNDLARRLLGQSQYPKLGVVDEGISGNRVVGDAFNGTAGSGTAGIAAVNREDRDILAQTHAHTLIILEGVNDLKGGTSPAQVIAGLQQLAARAHAQGMRVIGATITPFQGWSEWTSAYEANRQTVNDFIRNNGGAFDAVVDFDAVVRDPSNPAALLAAYDSGDHLHPGSAGYQAMANAIDLSTLN